MNLKISEHLDMQISYKDLMVRTILNTFLLLIFNLLLKRLFLAILTKAMSKTLEVKGLLTLH